MMLHTTGELQRTLCVAPMLDYTDRHCRYFMRLLSPHALLYTEMVVSNAVLHGDRQRLLAFDAFEQPVAIQLGGSDPVELAIASRLVANWGYKEINLNVGCPSDRVQQGRFGACLMREPALVAACINAMREQVALPITVKTRIGVDHDDSYAFLRDFIAQVATAGCTTFIIHARKAWLKGLSPKQNRSLPPLCYERLIQLKTDFPHLEFILNGGITSIAQIQQWLPQCDGIMVGRTAYENPAFLVACEQALFDPNYTVDLHQIVEHYVDYMSQQDGVPIAVLIKPLLGLWHGYPGARAWRRCLTEGARSRNATPKLVLQAVAHIKANATSQVASEA